MTNNQLQESYSAISRIESVVSNLALGKLEMTATLRQMIFADIKLIKNNIATEIADINNPYERINFSAND